MTPTSTAAGLRLSRRAALAWPLALPAGLLAGTPGVDEPPAAQPPRPLVLPRLDERRLANGLTLVVAPRAGLPLVSITLLVRAGAETDPPGRSGTAAMTTTLWPKGALRAGRPVSATTLARQAEALGGALDSHSSWGASSLSMTVSSPRLAEALALMTDVLRHPLLTADELARARAQALDGLQVTLSNPSEVASLALRRAFWGDGPYGRVAPPSAIQRLQRADLLAFQTHWVRPDRVSLVLAGDVSLAQAQALAQRLLGDWRVPDQRPPLLAPAAPAPMRAPLLLIDMPGSGESGVAVAAPYLANHAADAPDRYAALVANAVLGGGYSARLNQEVRIKRGLSYGAGSSVESHLSGGMFSAQAQTNHPSAAEVLALLRGEITRLADAAPGAEELAARQAALLGSFARRFETTSGLAALLAGQLAQGRPLAELSVYSAGLLAVSPQQVRDFARRFWQPARLRAVVAGDLTAAGEGLAAAAQPQALRLNITALDLEQPVLGARP
jgi:zinc protease